MEKNLQLLSEIEFSDLPVGLQLEVQSLSEKIGADIAFSGEETMAILSDWHLLEQHPQTRGEIAELCKKIIAATPSLMLEERKTPSKHTIRPQRDTKSLSLMMRNFSEKSSALGYSANRFEPSHESAKKMISVLNKAIKKGYSLEETKTECEKAGLASPDTAFVLNFAHCYWPAFEAEADLRESPKSMVNYLMAEPISNLPVKGYCSFFICLMSDDGKPAGIVNGAIGDVNRILGNSGLEMPAKEMTATFIGYVALPPSAQRSGADKVLLYESEKLVESTGRKTDYFLTQVDKPANMLAELEKLKQAPGGKEEEIAAMEQRIRAARILMRLWPERYGLKCVEGMKSMEIIHKYGIGEELFLSPEKQPQLELLVRPSSGKPEMPMQDLRALVTALYLYYEVAPGARIRKTGEPALERYVDYSLEGINVKGGNVTLSDASSLLA
jgi:hypothetical protein